MICQWDRNDINNFFSIVVVVSLLMRDNFFFAMKLFDYFVFPFYSIFATQGWCGALVPWYRLGGFTFIFFCCFVTFSHCLRTLLNHSFSKDRKKQKQQQSESSQKNKKDKKHTQSYERRKKWEFENGSEANDGIWRRSTNQHGK